MYLFALFLCGIVEIGMYFFFYDIVEIILIAIIGCVNKQKEQEHSLSVWKSVSGLVSLRICSTVACCVIFSGINHLLIPEKKNGWKMLDYWFPPDISYLYYPYWHLIIIFAVCLILTLATFQISILQKRKLLYNITISITTFIMFCILTSAGLPLYWH